MHFAAGRFTLVFGLIAGVAVCFAQSALVDPELPGMEHSWKLKLLSFVPEPGRTAGVYLKVRINGGRPLRLVLDSGAEHLVVSSSLASDMALPAGQPLSLIGFGGPAKTDGVSTVARTVEIGPLTLHDCPVDVVPYKVVAGADGVVPLVLFSDYLVRLDLPGKVLELTPYQQGEASRERFTAALKVRAVLFVRTVLNGMHNGYYLLDTGAAHNAISRTTALELGDPASQTEMRSVRGASGDSEVPQVKVVVHFRAAGHEIASDDVVLVNLDTFSRFNGVEVAGLLGYPALRAYVLTVDYRRSMVRMQAAGER